MTTAVQQMCDAIATDLTTNVSGLSTAIVHKYAPWNPEEMAAQVGETHLAVWIAAEAESASPLTSAAHSWTQVYRVLVWQEATDSQGRRMQDVTKDLAFLQLWESVKARFYVAANQFPSGTSSERTWYQGTQFPEDSGTMRWFLLTFTSELYQGFS